MCWEIYYDDETIISSNDMNWEDTPSNGVLFVKEINPSGTDLIHMGMDYYFKRDDTIISCGLAAIHSHMELGFGRGAVKFGRWAPDDIWKKVHNKVFSY